MGALELVCLHTDEGVELMVLDLPFIRSGVGPCKLETVVHALAYGSLGDVLDVGGEVIKRSEAAVFARGVVHAENSFDLEVLDGLDLCIGVCREIGVLILVVLEHLHHAVRVAVVHIPVGVARVVQLAVGVIDGSKR